MTENPEVIRVVLDRSVPETFRIELLAEITQGIRMVMDRYDGRVREADIEIAIGTLYRVKWALEGRKEGT